MTTVIRGKLPIRRDLTMKRGADFPLTIKLKAADGATPIDTTGYVMTMTIKQSPNGETYDTLTNGNGITMTAALGLFVFRRAASAVDAYDFTNAVYDIIITDGSGNKTCPFYGEVTLIP